MICKGYGAACECTVCRFVEAFEEEMSKWIKKNTKGWKEE